MKKILQIVDTYDWAIGTLAKSVVKACPHFDWKLMAIHPKDLEQGKIDLKPVIDAINWADVIDFQYWRVASQLFDLIPELKNKPVFMTHHNEKNLLSYEWPSNVIHITTTKYSEKVMTEAYPNAIVHYVPNSFDHNVFQYNQDFPPEIKSVGYVGRVLPWKGLKEIAKACYELGYPLMMMGKMDKPSYFAEIPQEHRDIMNWDYFNCDDSDRVEYYKQITCYVGNSGGGRETGPLGVMEAMACGVPVVSTPSGIVADIGEDGENMMVVDYDDYDGLKEAIKQVMESPALQQKLRKGGWETIRGYSADRRGMIVRSFFNKLFYKNPLVSVVIPAHPEREEQVYKILDAIEQFTYKDREVVVVFDQVREWEDGILFMSNFREAVKSRYSYPIHVKATNNYGNYGLALARNLGVIEADGEYIMFNDSRMKPEPDAIEQFLEVVNSKGDHAKVWVFGEKGGTKSTFVENFSLIRRDHFIKGGMCNERINQYGGMSQELRARFASQGFEFGYVPTAKAVQLVKSSLVPAKRNGIIEMKNLLFKMGLN